MTDRDHFAAAALAGLLAGRKFTALDDAIVAEAYAEAAYGIADAMLRERGNHIADASKMVKTPTNLDAAPESKAAPSESSVPLGKGHGTGDTPVTEPMTKEKRAEVSVGWRSDIRPPDAADRAAAAACDEAWGITTEPVAWAVVYPNDEVAVIAFKRRDADGRASASDRVVPLYRQPQPTLTDEEREAVRFFSLIDGPHNVPVANKRAATLRGLLERTT